MRQRIYRDARYGTGESPGWVSVLIAAETWGTAPWEIAGGSQVLWFRRWRAFQSERLRAAADKNRLDK